MQFVCRFDIGSAFRPTEFANLGCVQQASRRPRSLECVAWEDRASDRVLWRTFRSPTLGYVVDCSEIWSHNRPHPRLLTDGVVLPREADAGVGRRRWKYALAPPLLLVFWVLRGGPGRRHDRAEEFTAKEGAVSLKSY